MVSLISIPKRVNYIIKSSDITSPQKCIGCRTEKGIKESFTDFKEYGYSKETVRWRNKTIEAGFPFFLCSSCRLNAFFRSFMIHIFSPFLFCSYLSLKFYKEGFDEFLKWDLMLFSFFYGMFFMFTLAIDLPIVRNYWSKHWLSLLQPVKSYVKYEKGDFYQKRLHERK